MDYWIGRTICLKCGRIKNDTLKMTFKCTHKHTICKQCINKHIEDALKNIKDEIIIKCIIFGCNKQLTYGDMKRVANEENFRIYDEESFKRAIEKFEDFRWCMHLCGTGQIHLGDENSPIMTCWGCEKKTCFKHKVRWHEGKTCKEYDETLSEAESATRHFLDQNTKTCPKCKIIISKDEYKVLCPSSMLTQEHCERTLFPIGKNTSIVMESTTSQNLPESIKTENTQGTNVQQENPIPQVKKRERAAKKEKLEQKRRSKEERKANPTQQVQEIIVDPFLRQMIPITENPLDVELTDREKITIMTYNILAQSLCRRELYPDSHESLKWKYRRPRLIKEILYYDPDVACFQEMDESNYRNTFKPEFERAGYELLYFKSEPKSHGCCIIWKRSKFTKLKDLKIEFDKLEVSTMPTNCVGLIVSLECIKASRQNSVDQGETKSGIIIGTTHLYWRPQCMYERARQSLLLYENLIKLNEEFGFVTFLAGGQYIHLFTAFAPVAIYLVLVEFNSFCFLDFNSSPETSAYRLMVQRESALTKQDIENLKNSMRYFDGKKDDLDGKVPSPSTVDNEACRESDRTSLTDDCPSSSVVVPAETSSPFPPCEPSLSDLFSRFSILPRCTSLYSKYYHIKDPDNTFLMEPKYTNYGLYFKGTVDYIFHIHSCLQNDDYPDETKNEKNIEKINSNANESLADDDKGNFTRKAKKTRNQEIKVSSILRMPTEEEIGTSSTSLYDDARGVKCSSSQHDSTA
ncbi:3259_t:CDS:2 [Acaulospora morrowiae]|uniref:3259_t:CDS:1 n=1 Tax=Acaulospora morrowiae TaxID=94023 RepID=A0A9N8WI03_9GLOM|nr:3259_t:CDS:2 [Acaulospora morrowiae]